MSTQTTVEMWTKNLRTVIAALLNASQRNSKGVGMNRSARGWTVKHYPKDWIQCCVNKNIPLLEVFLQVLRQPGTILVDKEWTISRVTSIGSLLSIPTLCVVQVGVISRRNRIGSRTFMVLLQIYWIKSGPDNCNDELCGRGECHIRLRN